LLVTPLGTDGKASWTTDTGIGRLEQVLPDEGVIAFIGTHPAVPDKLPEPILVMIRWLDNDATVASSLGFDCGPPECECRRSLHHSA